ncbi:hypothetical protein ACFQ9X_04460 [Catenulispora yoronensis]
MAQLVRRDRHYPAGIRGVLQRDRDHAETAADAVVAGDAAVGAARGAGHPRRRSAVVEPHGDLGRVDPQMRADQVHQAGGVLLSALIAPWEEPRCRGDDLGLQGF